ncbi:hypothetical protein BLAT2472_80299 [Burkholderia latens]
MTGEPTFDRGAGKAARVGSTHCHVAASGLRNSSDRFQAMSLKGELTQLDPLRSYDPLHRTAVRRV